MKKYLIIFLILFTFLAPLQINARQLNLMDDTDLELVVRDVPDDLKIRLGDNYILIDFEFFKELEESAAKVAVLEGYNTEILQDLEVHKVYLSDLEAIIGSDRKHIIALDEHIDRQEKIIKSLRPTRWDKYKFGIGILLGVTITGVGAYGASQLD